MTAAAIVVVNKSDDVLAELGIEKEGLREGKPTSKRKPRVHSEP